MKGQRKSIPSKQLVRSTWAERLLVWHKFDSQHELEEADYCWACGFANGGTERCHILAVAEGGDNSPENIHLLCHLCHIDSEMLSGDAYWRWFHGGGAFGRFSNIARMIEASIARMIEASEEVRSEAVSGS